MKTTQSSQPRNAFGAYLGSWETARTQVRGSLRCRRQLAGRRTWALILSLMGVLVTNVSLAAPPVDKPPTPVGTQPPHESKPDSEKKPEPKTKRALDLSSPRATMRTFLLAVQEAAADHPERIEDAVSCLDTSSLTGDDTADQARRLAQRLHAVIQARGVTLDDIPEAPQGDDYLFLETRKEATEKPAPEKPAPEIRLHRSAVSGAWHFTAQTLASIPALEASLKTEEKKTPISKEQAKVPVGRRSARATLQTFLNAMNAEPPDLIEAVRCFDPTGRDVEAWRIKGAEFATTLKAVMDRIKLVVLAEAPDAPDAPPYVWYAGKSGQIALARIEEKPPGRWPEGIAPVPGEWRFTRKTADGLNALFRKFENKPIIRELREAGIKERLSFRQRLERQLPDWARKEIWKTAVWQWTTLAALLVIGWIVLWSVSSVTNASLRVWLSRQKITLDSTARRRMARSTGAFVMILVWYFAIRVMGLPDALLGPLSRGITFLMGVTAVWMAYRFVDVLGGKIAADQDLQLTRFDDVLIPMLRKIMRFFVVIVGFLLIAEWMGKEWTTIFGVLGIGGVALAFAAQDTIGNFFGSITVLFDRPFGIGDWIKMGDVEGTVERVGFRSTRVRTFYNSVVTVPNSKMANTQVDNYGARQFRRVRIMLSITYNTPPETIDAFCEGIRELIRLHPYTRKDYYHVYLNQFAASSLDILLYMFFETPDWSTELRERHRLFVDILRLAKRIGVEFAFPTRTVWLEKEDEPKAAKRMTLPTDAEAETLGVQEAAKLFDEIYGRESTPRGPVVIDTKPRSKK